MDFKLLWKHLVKAWFEYKKELEYKTTIVPKYTKQIHAHKIRNDIKYLEFDIVRLTEQICSNITAGLSMGKEHLDLVTKQETKLKELKALKMSALKEGIIVPNLGKIPTKDKVEQILSRLDNIKKASIEEHVKETMNVFEKK